MVEAFPQLLARVLILANLNGAAQLIRSGVGVKIDQDMADKSESVDIHAWW